MCQLINMKVFGVLLIVLLMLRMHASQPTSNLVSNITNKTESAGPVTNGTDGNGANNNKDDDAAPLPESNNKDDDVAPLLENNTNGNDVAPLPESNNKDDDVAPLPESNNKDDDAAPLPENNTDGDDAAPLSESNAEGDDAGSLPALPVNNKADKEGGDRIIGGQIYSHGSSPWQISLNYQGSHSCGGSILNEWSILTAAHCVDTDTDVSQYTVVVGEHDFTVDEGTEITIGVQTIIIHQCYNVTNYLEHDVAVLHLDESLTFSYYVQPVLLSDYRFDSKALRNRNCYTSGWGSITDYDDYPSTLYAARVTIARNSKCNKRMARSGYHIFFPSVCTMNYRRATCSGDSGGPLGCFDKEDNFRQIGITSWGLNPCSRNPSIYARVSYYARWINENMLNNY